MTDQNVPQSKGASRLPNPRTGLRAAAMGEGGVEPAFAPNVAYGPAQSPREPLSVQLLTAATRLWGQYRAGELTYDELDRALLIVERLHGENPKVCDSCFLRHATINESGDRWCAKCRNDGSFADQAYADHKEREA